MDEFLSELKKVQKRTAMTQEEVIGFFKSTGIVNKRKAEKEFKAALKEVARWKFAPLQSWAFNQVLDNRFPILDTTWYQDYWRDLQVKEAQKENVSRQLELVYKKGVQISTDILDENTFPNDNATPAAAQEQGSKNASATSWSEVFERNDKSGDISEAEGEAADDDDEQNFRSDISDDAHPRRIADYQVTVTTSERNDLDAVLVEHPPWILDGFNISEQLSKARLSCLEIDCRKLSDVRLLLLNNIFLFVHEDPANSVIKFLEVYAENDYDGSRGLNFLKALAQRHSYEAQKTTISDQATLWCNAVSQHATDDWFKIQSTTLPFLLVASRSEDKHDLIVANILHQQALEFAGNKSKSTFEDAYVHRCISTIFKTVFQSDPLFDYDWANGSLLGKRRSGSGSSISKPDFVAFVATRRDVVVGEIKPPLNSNSTNTGEPDLVKLGRMMRNMYNDLVAGGICNPTIGGILVHGTDMRTFVLQLEFSKKYELVQLSQSEVFRNCNTMSLLPALVNNLLWLKNIIRPTAIRVLTTRSKKANGHAVSPSSPPLEYLDNDERILTRIKKQKKC